MMRRAILDFAMFELVWLACAIGAGRGWSWPGIVIAMLAVAVRLAPATNRRGAVLTILASGALGSLAESLLVGSGLVRYAAPWPTVTLAPAWIIALWLAFGTTLDAMRTLLGAHSQAKAALLGAVLGPLSYLAGEQLGALALPQPAWPSYLVVGLIWALALPALLAVQGRRSWG